MVRRTDNDAGGISTYAATGSRYGFSLLAAGGYGFIIGDGTLHYGPETILAA